MDLLGIVLLAIGLVFFAVLIAFLLIYNSLIRLQNNIRKSWANIDVLLKQRSDELPNLIASVKGYMDHERTTLETLTKARTDLLRASTMSKKAVADIRITQALKMIFAVAESYPTLKANENFLKLQNRITALENQLADRREFYNDSVNIYNIRIHSIPDLLIARLVHYTDEPLFKASADESTIAPVQM